MKTAERIFTDRFIKEHLKTFFTVLISPKCKSEHYTLLFLACHCLDVCLLPT